MISVIPTTDHGDAAVILVHPDGERTEVTHGGVEDMDQLAAELRRWCEEWRDEPAVCSVCDGEKMLTCRECGGTGGEIYVCGFCKGRGCSPCIECEGARA